MVQVKKNKVKLRLYKDADFEFLHGLLSDPATKKYFPFMYTAVREQTFIRLDFLPARALCGSGWFWLMSLWSRCQPGYHHLKA